MNVWITIRGVYEPGGNQERLEFTTAGTLTVNNGSACVSYEEDPEAGMSGVTTTFRLTKEGCIMLERTGTTQSVMIIEESHRHLCHYHTGPGGWMVGVFGERVRGQLDETGGEIHLRYTIDVNSDLVSRNEVFITVKKKG